MAIEAPIDESPDEVKRLLAPLRSGVSVALCHHGNPYSVGGIIRVAHSFLVREIFIIGAQPWYEKASMGMHRYETVHVVPSDSAFLDAVGDRPLWAVEKDHAAVSLFAVEEYPPNVVFVFGSERGGIGPAILSRATQVVGIPMYGINHSYPVVVTVGMVLCDWARHRFRDGTTV